MTAHRVVAGLLLVSSVLAPALQATPAAADGGTRLIANGGSAVLVSRPFGPEGGVQPPEFPPTDIDAAREGDQGSDVQLRRGAGPSTNVANTSAVQPVPSTPSKPAANVRTSFDGLNLRQQRLANGGNQFTVEPPDQGLCVGNGFVVETINDVFRVFDTSGNPLTGVIDLNTFYGYAPQLDRGTGLEGPFVTDPSCWFDVQTQRFYHIVLTLEVFPDSGAFTGVNHLDLAVSKTSNPISGWNIYRTDATDDGSNGTPNHGCPPGNPATPPTHPNACIGDFPHIGADANGIFVTTNEYCLFCAGIGFHAAQVYAFDKRALAAGASAVHVTQIDTVGMQNGKPGFTLWPATTPDPSDFETAGNGTEYFSSSNAAEEVSGVPNSHGTNSSNEIVTWGLSNTASLTSATPNITLRNAVVNVERYSPPPPSNQKPGNFPLGQCLNDTTTPTIFGTIGCWTVILAGEPPHNQVEGQLDSSDSRVLSTTFSNARLYGTLDTGVRVNGTTQAGVLYYVIRPRVRNSGVEANLMEQGQIALASNNVIYGTIASTHTRRTVIGFTLVGNDHYPTAAYMPLKNGHAGPVNINVIAEGAGPTDGFTEYGTLTGDDPARPRWGDYGASVASDDNTIWLGAEYIAQTCTLSEYMSAPFGSCGGTRVTLGNWATRITSLDLSKQEPND
jgi:hypothetical protein